MRRTSYSRPPRIQRVGPRRPPHGEQDLNRHAQHVFDVLYERGMISDTPVDLPPSEKRKLLLRLGLIEPRGMRNHTTPKAKLLSMVYYGAEKPWKELTPAQQADDHPVLHILSGPPAASAQSVELSTDSPYAFANFLHEHTLQHRMMAQRELRHERKRTNSYATLLGQRERLLNAETIFHAIIEQVEHSMNRYMEN